jgi:hypothetical protein
MSVNYPVRQTWTVVRVGLAMIYYGLLVTVISLLGFVLVQILLSGTGSDLGVAEKVFLVGLAVVVWVGLSGGGLAVIIGQVLCCLAPRGSGVKALALLSTACLLLSLGGVGSFMAATSTSTAAPPPSLVMLFWVGVGAGLLGHIIFLLFLRAVGNFFRDKDLTSATLFYVFSLVVVLVVFFGLDLLLYLLGTAGKIDGGILFVVLLAESLVGLFFQVYMLMLVGTACTVVAEAGERSGG